MLKTEKQVRSAFWQAWREGQFAGLNVTPRQITDYSGHGKMHNTDTRTAFVDWLDSMSRDGQVSQELAERVTLR